MRETRGEKVSLDGRPQVPGAEEAGGQVVEGGGRKLDGQREGAVQEQA